MGRKLKANTVLRPVETSRKLKANIYSIATR